MTNPVITNQKTTFDGNVNSDVGVRTVDSVAFPGKDIQVVTGGFCIPDHDYVAITYPNSTTEIYTHRTGGEFGTVVATVTVTYTTADKDDVSSISKV